MALLRCIHAAGMPDPGAVIDALQGGKPVPQAAAASAPADPAPPPPIPGPMGQGKPDSLATPDSVPLPADFRAFVAMIEKAGSMTLGAILHNQCGLAEYAPPLLKLQPRTPLDANFARELALKAKDATGQPWQIDLVETGGGPSLRDQELMEEQRAKDAVLEDPMVKAVLDAFPETTLEKIQEQG